MAIGHSMAFDTRVVFLHIPKTAGQSVHAALIQLFGADSICKARVNEELLLLSLEEIRRSRVYSGHFDWSMLDCVPHPKFVFTILREPTERILSFYFFLRESAKTLTEQELELPGNQGRKAALRWSCDEYFCSKKPEFKMFINNHYNNFYAYYFAGRTFRGYQDLSSQQSRFSDERVVEQALKNLSALDGVYTVDDLSTLEQDLSRIAGRKTAKPLSEVRVNVGGSDPTARMESLRLLGATDATFEMLDQMTRLDRKIWETLFGGASTKAG
jgi:Sulfotransferase family